MHTTGSAAHAPELDAWRKAILAFLESHSTRRAQQPDAFHWGVGSDLAALFSEPDGDEEAAAIAAAKAWRRTVFDAGFGWITGPAEFGGRGFPSSYQRAYGELERLFDVPSQVPFGI